MPAVRVTLLLLVLGSATAVAEPRELDRPLIVAPGEFGATLGTDWTRTSTTVLDSTVHTNDADLTALVSYGLAQYVAAGASYSIPYLNRLGSKGTAALFVAVSFYDCGRWQAAASMRGSLDLDSEHRRDLELGFAARYRFRDDVSWIMGTPWSPGPLGRQLHLESGGHSVIQLSIGVQMQFGERVAVDLSSAIARLALPSGASATVFEETPITLGGWVALPRRLSVRASIGTSDLSERDDVEASFAVRYR